MDLAKVNILPWRFRTDFLEAKYSIFSCKNYIEILPWHMFFTSENWLVSGLVQFLLFNIKGPFDVSLNFPLDANISRKRTRSVRFKEDNRKQSTVRDCFFHCEHKQSLPSKIEYDENNQIPNFFAPYLVP